MSWYSPGDMSESAVRRRCVLAIPILGLAVALGTYPSAYSLHALLAIPALVFAMSGAMAPKRMAVRRLVGRYVFVCTVSSAAVVLSAIVSIAINLRAPDR